MTDGYVAVNTKRGPVETTARPAPLGGGAVIYSERVLSTSSASGTQTHEMFSFTLTQESNLYVNGFMRISETGSDGFYWLGFEIAPYRSADSLDSFHFSLQRLHLNRDNFDTVKLGPGSYTLYARTVGAFDEIYLNVQMIVGEPDDVFTMVPI